jgi:two-component system phosphate regulon sensor histidine kinase PhoR
MKRLWPNSLASKIFLSYLAIIVLLFASFYFAAHRLLRDFYTTSVHNRLEREAHLIARLLPFEMEGEALDSVCRELSRDTGARITVVAADGRVLGDSAEPSVTMENHQARPEIAAALSSGSGAAVRYSTTVGYSMLYRAFYQPAEGQARVVRVALPLTDLENTITSLRRAILVVFLSASAVGLLAALVFSRHLRRRLNGLSEFSRQVAQGSFPQNFFHKRRGDEIESLEQQLNEMGREIRDQLARMAADKEKVDSILRCMIEGLLVLDRKGRVLVANERAQSIFEIPAGRELHGASIAEVCRHPELRELIADVLASDADTCSYSKEMQLGEGRWFRFNAARLTDGQGGALGSVLVFHDVSEIKRLETIRSDFVANVSHELRTPLTAIRGYVETLLHAPSPDPNHAKEFLAIIDRHAERLSRLLGDLLTLSDIESGNAPLSFTTFETCRLLERAFEMVGDRAEKKGIRLAQLIEPGAAWLSGDFDRLQQLLINLVDNAVKHTPPAGRVTITARRTLGKNGEGRLELAVADTGSGIPEKDLPRLTERFYRVDKTRSRELGGTGLGLAIVKHIVQAHGGELKIESALNRGTTVRVLLPAPVGVECCRAVLFLCTGNSCRSQMAEGFARQLAPSGTRVYSAGTDPKPIHPLAIQVMKELGIDISRQISKPLEHVPADADIDLVVTLCGDAAESCPLSLPRAARAHWPLPDPARAEGGDDEILAVFRSIRDDIRARVQRLFAMP